MKENLTQFGRLANEIEANSWWKTHIVKRSKDRASFVYSVDEGDERITDVPKEPFESLLMIVRQLTMNNSASNLHCVRKTLKCSAPNDKVRTFLDAWHSYWRLAFIKEPYLLTVGGETQVMTAYKAYNVFVNGKHFHSDSPQYNLVLYGKSQPEISSRADLFLQNQFHWTVANVCFAAFGLRLFVLRQEDRERVLADLVAPITDFIACVDQIPGMDEQYKIFSDWIEEHGGCKECRW